MLKLQGIYCPLATPFDHEGAIYKVKVAHNVGKANQVKLAGYVVGGATGEGALLAADERTALFELVKQSAADDRQLLGDVSAGGVTESVKLAAAAASLGYQGVLVRTPHAYVDQMRASETQELYFRAVADRAALPVVLVNSPAATGINLDATCIARLAGHPNIAGVCDASGDVGKLLSVVRSVPKTFGVLTGSSAVLWPALDLGAAGGILPIANAAPYACITIWEAHRTREREAALDWQGRILTASALIGGARYGVAGLKHAMDLNGFFGGPCRLPLAPLRPEARAEIAAAFDGIRG